MSTLPCFRCGKKLGPAIQDEEGNQPYAGTTFRASGQYGSTVFDPAVWEDGSAFLEINICDECLLVSQEFLLHGRKHEGPVTYAYRPWDPGMDVDVWRHWQQEVAERRRALLERLNPPS